MLIFRIVIGILGLIAISTGINDLWNGANVRGDFGDLGEMTQNPMLNFTLRFLGAIWAGFGALLILFITDVKRYDIALIASLIIVIIGGIGRLASTLQFGIESAPKTTIYMILAIELGVVPILLLCYLLLLRPNL